MLWQTARGVLDLSRRAALMGVVNVTPDSFSDGGRFFDPEAAVAHGLALATEGADILDVGGESTRPGAEPVGEAEELRRVVPVVEGLAARLPAVTAAATGGREVLISVDTSKAAVADAALAAGAAIVNDVNAGRGGSDGDPGIFAVVRRHGAGLVLMHLRGEPRTMQRAPRYDDVVAEVGAFLAERRAAAQAAGVPDAALAFDPGIGFGKTETHNFTLLRNLPALAASVSDRPLVVGVSRKRFLAAAVGRDPERFPAAERDAASVGVAVLARTTGARVLRVHAVRLHAEALRAAETVENTMSHTQLS